jgi:GNAT superfamily N-acetyltransferase
MSFVDITFVDNGLTPEIATRLFGSVGWYVRPEEQYAKALDNSLFSVTVVCGGSVVGMGRLIGDGVMDWYVKDIIVLPEYQGRGIGRGIMEYLLNYIKKHSISGAIGTVVLMAAKGKEEFYKKLGFRVRPNEREGAGMMLQYGLENN